jgi:uncharacterized membrane protein
MTMHLRNAGTSDEPNVEDDETLFSLSPRTSRILTWVLIGVFIAVIVGTIYVTTTAPPTERFTEFYLLGPGGMASDYPTNLTVGESGMIIVGITNREGTDLTYLVHVWLNDTKIGDLAPLTLAHDETSERTYTFTPTQAGSRWKLEFVLYRGDRSAVYRDLHLWVTVNEG